MKSDRRTSSSRSQHSFQALPRFRDKFENRPAQMMVWSFLSAMAIGTAFLMLPASTADGTSMPFIDALFMSTSAICVTGLGVVDNATYFSPFGKAVMLVLIQIGGLGIMMFSSFAALFLSRHFFIREAVALSSAMSSGTDALRSSLKAILIMTAVLEGAGAIILTLWFWFKGFSIYQACTAGIFMSVSAFCNAGFSVFPGNLESYRWDYVVSGTIMVLIFLGSIGFIVFYDLRKVIVNLFLKESQRRVLSMQTKMVLSIAVLLTIVGAVLYFCFEYFNPASVNLTLGQQAWDALFQSVSRTSGFNTAPIGNLRPPTLFMISILMFIGAAPMSTGGGIKTTTVGVLYLSYRSIVNQESSLRAFHRSLPPVVVNRAISVLFAAIGMVIVGTLLLSTTEQQPFIEILFEVVSASGTVGYSTGITPELTLYGKLTIILMMYLGRIGPLTMVLGITKVGKPERIRYPEDDVMIG